MSLKNSEEKYGSIAKLIHWLMAILIIGLLAVGIYMENMDGSNNFKWELYDLHKLFGMLVIALIVFRIIWKILNRGKPAMLESYSKHERIMAASAHGILYILMLIMPLSGWLMSSFGGHSVMVFGMDMMLPLEKNKELGGLFHEIHEIGGYVLIGLIILHVLGALKHHVVDKDDTLKRMLPECPKKCCGGCGEDK